MVQMLNTEIEELVQNEDNTSKILPVTRVAAKGHAKFARAILEYYTLDSRSSWFLLMIRYASKNKILNTTKALLEWWFTLANAEEDVYTIMHHAAEFRQDVYTYCLAYLINKGFNPSSAPGIYWERKNVALLCGAVGYVAWPACKMLVKAGVSVNGTGRHIPLIWPARYQFFGPYLV